MMPWGAGSLRWLNTIVGFSLPLCSCFSWVGVHALGHWDSEEDKSAGADHLAGAAASQQETWCDDFLPGES